VRSQAGEATSHQLGLVLNYIGLENIVRPLHNIFICERRDIAVFALNVSVEK
jgi:hypothetical protein